MTREYHLKRKFGLTLEQYDELLEKQGGGCALCGRTSEEEGKSLAVDHAHTGAHAGEVRGILCYKCNNFLVGKHDDPSILRKVADYLDQHTGWFVPPDMVKPKRRRRTARKGVKRGK